MIMAEANTTNPPTNLDDLSEYYHAESPSEKLVTQNTYRPSDSEDSGEDSLIDQEDLLSDILGSSPRVPSLPRISHTPTGKTQICQFIMDTSSELTVTPPVSTFSLREFNAPNNTPNFTVIPDFSDVSSGEEDFLINAVKSDKKKHRLSKSVANPHRSENHEDPDKVDFVTPPPDLIPDTSPKSDQVIPVQLFVNKLSTSKNTNRKNLTELSTIPVTKTASKSSESTHNSNKPSRFHKPDESEINLLQVNAKAERTQMQTAWGVKIFTEWLEFESLPLEFETLPAPELGELLRKFYASVRQQNGTKYSRSSLLCLRSALHRYLTGHPHNRQINLQTDAEFTQANCVITGIIRHQKKAGEDTSIKHPPISQSDISLMYSSKTLSDENPRALLYKTFFEVSLHYGRRGREGLKDLRKTDIIFKRDDKQIEYCTLAFNPYEKNHAGIASHQTEHSQQMFSTGGNDCPVQSLKKYLAKLHPDCPSFFQRPRRSGYSASTIWYCNSAMGLNSIGNLMSEISLQANLSHRYTNHSIRATCITQLKEKGVNPSDIISVTGHRNLGSLDAYSRTSEETRRKMSHHLSHAIGKHVPEENNTKSDEESEDSAQNQLNFEKEPTPKKRPKSILKPLVERKNTLKITPPQSPIQIVRPTPRKNMEKETDTPKTSPEGASCLQIPEHSSKKSEERIISSKKPVRQLHFDDENSTPDEMDHEKITSEKSRVNTGQTIIIEKGNIIHIHYH